MKIFRFLATLCLFAILAACGGGGGGGGGSATMPILPSQPVVVAPQPAPDATVAPVVERSCTVALYGDSILYGFTTKGRLAEPPAQVIRSKLPGFAIDDRSEPGDTLTRRSADYLGTKLTASLIVLQFGINDAAQRLAYEEPLRSFVSHAKASGAKVIITGLSYASTVQARGQYDDIARAVAAETGSAFADWGGVYQLPEEMDDPFHPGAVYSARLATRLADEISRNMGGCVPTTQ